MFLKNMNSDEKKDWIETFVGGGCGVIAIIAAIVEYSFGENGAIAGMLKDVFGTAVVVVLLIMAMPKKRPKKLAEILAERVEKWGADNAPMIFKTEDFVCAKENKYKQGFVLLQDPPKFLTLLDLDKNNPEWHSYASYYSKRTGKFLDLPSYDEMVSNSFDVLCVLDQKHFTEKKDIKEIIVNIVAAIEKRFKKEIAAERIKVTQIGNSEKFIIEFATAIENKKEVEFFISVIDYILSLVKIVA